MLLGVLFVSMVDFYLTTELREHGDKQRIKVEENRELSNL
jgi:hypothetical protein